MLFEGFSSYEEIHLKLFEDYWTAGHEDWTPESDNDPNPATGRSKPDFSKLNKRKWSPGDNPTKQNAPDRTAHYKRIQDDKRSFDQKDARFAEMGRKSTELKESIEGSDIPRLKKIIDEIGVNYDNNIAARLACRLGKQDVYKVLTDLGYKPTTDREKKMEACWAADNYQLDMIKFLYNTHGSIDGDAVKKWIVHSRKLDDQKRKEIGELIDSLKSLRREDRVNQIVPESRKYRK